MTTPLAASFSLIGSVGCAFLPRPLVQRFLGAPTQRLGQIERGIHRSQDA